MTLNCLIVDDEPLARKGLADYVREIPFLRMVGECSGAAMAEEVLRQTKVDLMLLDIQMPHQSGIEFLKSITNPPMVIFTTAFSEYALEGYALDVMDFLVKPIAFDRFLKAVTKARDFQAMKSAAAGEPAKADYLFVKANGKFERVFFDEIVMVEAMQNYVMIHSKDTHLIVYMTLSGMEGQLPHDKFMKVHKSYVIALSKVDSIDGHEVVMGQFRVPVSRNLRDEVMKRIMGNNLLQR